VHGGTFGGSDSMKPDDMPVMPARPCSSAATSAALPPAAFVSAAPASAGEPVSSV
jgi:hypothetical protein